MMMVGSAVDFLLVVFALLCLVSIEVSDGRGGLVRADVLVENGAESDMLFAGGDGGKDEVRDAEGGMVSGAGMFEEGEESRSRREDGEYLFLVIADYFPQG